MMAMNDVDPGLEQSMKENHLFGIGFLSVFVTSVVREDEQIKLRCDSREPRHKCVHLLALNIVDLENVGFSRWNVLKLGHGEVADFPSLDVDYLRCEGFFR